MRRTRLGRAQEMSRSRPLSCAEAGECPELARPRRSGRAKPVRLCPCRSDVDLFSYGQGVIDFDTKIPDRAPDLRMSQQQLDSPQVGGPTVDECRLVRRSECVPKKCRSLAGPGWQAWRPLPLRLAEFGLTGLGDRAGGRSAICRADEQIYLEPYGCAAQCVHHGRPIGRAAVRRRHLCDRA